MNRFNRGISQNFVNALNREYNNNGWWRKVADDQRLFVGIREDYVDIYFNGRRILNLKYKSGNFSGRTHFKYLLNVSREDEEKDHVTFRDGVFKRVTLKSSYDDLNNHLEGILESADTYQKGEKVGVHHIALLNGNIIDTEIQIPGENLRVDFAALQKRQGEIRVVFFEAKLFSSKELRSGGHRNVLNQISSYQEVIDRRREEIGESYQRVCRNISQMKGWGDRRSNLFAEAMARNLVVDPEVRLAVFQFDEAQRDAANGENGIFNRLRGVLGRKRVLVTGDPTKFTTGIKSLE